MQRHTYLYILIVLLSSSLAGCQNISCPLDNVVLLGLHTYNGDEKTIVGDTLTVTACGTDSVLVNRLYNFSELQLPMHNTSAEATLDTFILNWKNYPVADTLYLNHNCTIHFETIDCPPAVFHTLHNVHSTHYMLDSVSIIHPLVNYEKQEHLRLYMRLATE